MPYIDSEYYLNVYKGKPTSDTQLLEQSIQRASDKVDMMIGFKIKSQQDLDKLHEFQLKQLKLATAALTEYYIINGGQLIVENESGLSSASIGDFSFSEGDKGATTTKRIPSNVMEYLSYTGLLYSGVQVAGDYWL